MFKLVGYREVSFKAQDGNKIEGIKLFFEFTDKNISGVGVESINYFKTDYQYLDLELNANYEIYYNKYGKIQELRKVG